MSIDQPETNAGAPPLGAGQHRRNFLVPRGMTALPSGEESCDDAVALKRSKRIALFFGQIGPLKRPFGAVETRGRNGDVAILRLRQDAQTAVPAYRIPVFQAMRISLPGLFYRHCPHPDLVSRQTLALTVLRSPGPRLCLRLIRCLQLSAAIFMTKMEDDPHPRPFAINGLLRFKWARFPSGDPVAAMPATGRKAVMLRWSP